jgi:ATP-dependent Clp protease ATP-binding subunit ClpA
MYLDHNGTTGEPYRTERSMFGRFTDEARRVLDLALDEASTRGSNRIGTEHILLGLVCERDGIAAEALESAGIGPDAVRQQIEEISGQGHEAPAPSHQQYTLRAKRALDLSLREALQLGHHHIGTEHILLGLLRDGEGPAAQVLIELGADRKVVRGQVLRLLDDAGGAGATGSTANAQSGEGGGQPAPAAAGVAGAAGPVPAGAGPGGTTLEGRMLAQILGQIEAMDARLSAVEQQLGSGPDVGDLDRQIAQARQDKESAAGAEDYEHAAALRDTERRLVADKAARQKEWADAHPDLPSLAEGLHMLSDEVGRLRGLLTQQGGKSRDGAA